MSITQKQIAEHLGVSQSLVTQSLRDLPRIPEATRDRIKQAAKELGYNALVHNEARLLQARRNGIINTVETLCVLTGGFFEGLPINEVPFYQPILRGMKAEAARRDVNFFFANVVPEKLPRFLAQSGADGVLGLYSGPLTDQARANLPCPMLRVGDGLPHDWALRPDDERGIYLVTRHLIELGHRHIGYIGDLGGHWTRDVMYKSRFEGYLGAMRDGALPVRDKLIEAHVGAPGQEAGAMGAGRILDRQVPVSALVCFNDSSALGAIAELSSRGLSVPGDISVTGFDDATCNGDGPALTTVAFDRHEMGRRAVEALYQAAAAGRTAASCFAAEHELLPVELVKRASSGKPAGISHSSRFELSN